jgi:hypothetical protein
MTTPLPFPISRARPEWLLPDSLTVLADRGSRN